MVQTAVRCDCPPACAGDGSRPAYPQVRATVAEIVTAPFALVPDNGMVKVPRLGGEGKRGLEMKRFCAAAVAAACLAAAGTASAQSQYIGEVRLFATSYCPVGWLAADGRLLAIPQNQALFALLSNTYGGDAIRSFALPNLSGRAPVGVGVGPNGQPHLGEAYGAASTVLTPGQLPGPVIGEAGHADAVRPGPPAPVQPVATQSPSLAMTWCVSITGLFPPRP